MATRRRHVPDEHAEHNERRWTADDRSSSRRVQPRPRVHGDRRVDVDTLDWTWLVEDDDARARRLGVARRLRHGGRTPRRRRLRARRARDRRRTPRPHRSAGQRHADGRLVAGLEPGRGDGDGRRGAGQHLRGRRRHRCRPAGRGLACRRRAGDARRCSATRPSTAFPPRRRADPVLRVPAAPDAAAGVEGASVVFVHGGPESVAMRNFNPTVAALTRRRLHRARPERPRLQPLRQALGLPRRRRRCGSTRCGTWPRSMRCLPSLGLDPARVRAVGWLVRRLHGAGGVSMQPTLWAAGVDIVGMSSLVTFLENTSAYRRAFREREYGSLDRDRDFLVRRSPITYLDDIGRRCSSSTAPTTRGSRSRRPSRSRRRSTTRACRASCGCTPTRATGSPSGPTGSTPTRPRSGSSANIWLGNPSGGSGRLDNGFQFS